MTSAEQVLRLLRADLRLNPEHLVRTLMLVYLVDWKSSIEFGETITESTWARADWGPYSPEVVNAIISLRSLSAHASHPNFDSNIELRKSNIISDIRDKYAISDKVRLTKLVFSTYPMVYGSAADHLDLPQLAKKYRKDFEKARDRATA